jgi:outer membrane protein assembly factor BamB
MLEFNKKMKSTNLYGKSIAIALILVLTLSSAVAILPTIKAQTLGSQMPYSYTPTKGSNGLWNYPTFPGVTDAPNPVGVGQPVQVIMIIELLPPSVGEEGVTAVTGGWLGLTLTVTDPNGTSTTMGPYETDVSGTYQIGYTPDTVGTYTFVMNFPGQTVNGTGFGSLFGNFLPSTASTSLTVQQTPIQGYSEAPVPLPTQYWTTPIDAQNRAWNTISGPWLQPYSFQRASGYNSTGAFNPYTYAPQSGHILWSKVTEPNAEGIAGGAYGPQEFGGENLVVTGFTSPIVMGGYVYYDDAGNNLLDNNNGTVVSTFSCMNLQTGQIMYTVPGSITNGQILEWRSQQQKSTYPYLWNIADGSFTLYDATTGTLLAQWGNVPAGSAVAAAMIPPVIFGPAIPVPTITPTAVTPMAGTITLEQPHPTVVGQTIGGAEGGGAVLDYIYGYNPGATTGWLACWNSTLAISSYCNDPAVWNLPATVYFPTIAQQATTPLDWDYGIMWNMTIPLPTFNEYYFGYTMPASWSILGADGNYVVLDTFGSSPTSTGTQSFTLAAVNVANQPMTTTYTEDVGGDTQHTTTGTFAWIENITQPAYDETFGGLSLDNGGNILFTDTSTLSLTDYSENTGALLWSTTPFNNAFAMQSTPACTVAYGMLYAAGYDGYMHAINITTGVQVWDSITIAGGLEMPQPAYPATGATVADNEVFTTTAKAYESQPYYRGHCLYAYDATTGAQNWNISGQYSSIVIADGILVGVNAYDGETFAFSRGPTATTVSAPQTSITSGSSVIIQGTVTDQTPTSQAQGTPAISDTWMTPWMEYLYMDQPLPHDATGVPVSIDAVDPNGNYIHIGNATSDITGSYSYQWTPPDIPGKYTIITTFGSDNSYYGSSGETAAVVVSPAATAVSPTPTPTSVADMYFVPAIAGLAVLIAIVAIVLALLMLRKHP